MLQQEKIFESYFLSDDEKRKILIEWNKTEREYPKDKTIHQLFEEQVEKTPDSIALIFADQKLTYRALNERANQLAHCLKEKGIEPETLVAIACERSLEMIVGILGILKAGGAYVPIDASYPQERIKFMLEDTKARLLLSQQDVLEILPRIEAEVFLLDKYKEKLRNYPITNLHCVTKSHHLAYVMYTSGTTGRPKGVMIEHKGVCVRLAFWQESDPLKEDDVFLQQASISFDASVEELFWPLSNGVTVVLAYSSKYIHISGLATLISSHKITFLQCTPSLLKLFLEPVNLEQLRSLRKVFVSGEALTHELKEEFLSKLPKSELKNVYGITETTVDTMMFTCKASDEHYVTQFVPIGQPISNTQVYILDTFLNPVPIGVIGELHVGGDALARGYLNRPELTAEKFIENTFRTKEEKNKGKRARLYKTGDLAQYLPDGNIEYIGRVDDQVKIRGVRIELGEIEVALVKHSQVKEALVIVREDTPGDKRLVAYLVLNKDGAENQGTVEISELRTHVQTILPDYMIPSAFVALEGIPLTDNGKVDRKGLPAPEYQGDKKSYVAPRTEIEKVLCEIWQGVLKIEKVGIYDNFFMLGGHSLLATQVVSRLRSQYDIEVSLKDFFENAVVAHLSQIIEESLKEAREEILPLVVVERTENLPLSFAQQRLWFVDQLEHNNTLYSIPIALKFKGFLDQGALQIALNKLIERHEVLRTAFKAKEGKPYQVIQKHLELDLPLIDVSLLKGNEKASKVEECIQEETLIPFSLVDGPLIRAALIKLKEQEHIFLLMSHHSVADEWSFGVIYEELSELYNAALEKRKAQLTSLPVQYVDFSIWQREYLNEEGEIYKKLLSYWIDELKGAPALLELPTDHPRPPVQSYKGSHRSFSISSDLTKELKELSEETQGTLFMTLLAAFYTLLYRYSNQEDMVVGSPIANRNRQELEHLVGFFVNTLALRVNLSPDLSFKDLLSQVKQKTLEAYDHQDLPFEKLVEHLGVERSLAHESIFQVMFVLQNAAENTELKLKGLKIEEVPFEYPISMFDLTLNLTEIEGQLQGSFEYAIDLFKPSTIERMQKHFQNLLEEIVNNPNKSLSQLEMLTSEEKQQLLVTWNETQKEYPKDKIVHQLFEEEVKKTPDNIALIFGDQRLTYQELNERANQLAHHLRERGVKPDTLVGIACEQSLEMIVGILGILKAGGAYVPIDPSYPQERIKFMLEDTKAHLLLTQSSILAQLPQTQSEVLLLDKEELLKEYSHTNPSQLTKPHHLAYVIYTSGTTGRPKGVMIEHKGVCVRLAFWQESDPLKEDDVFLQQASISFDASVEELFWPLSNGATVVLAYPSKHANIGDLATLIASYKITFFQCTPSLLKLVLEQFKLEQLDSLRKVFVGGEALSHELKEECLKKLPKADLKNSYGPTETTVDAMIFPCKVSENLCSGQFVPIGQPISNTQGYILDTFLNLAPVGVIGELYIGGDGLARGYLNRPELTAEKFIVNPFQTKEEKDQGKKTRLYKTGDMCRWLEDGNIEYIGRSDDQVKIRGFRIELGEIEAALLQHVQVKEAVVIAREDTPGDKRLVGYLVFKKNENKDQKTVEISELRTHLQASLPDYMIPSAFVTLEAIPLTTNGKVDRKGLPAPEYQGDKKSYVAPITETHKALCEIWQSVLKIEKVGIYDNFFALGGHSLLATQVVSRLRSQYGIEVSLRDFFKNAVIENLTQAIEQSQKETREEGLPLSVVERTESLPLSFGQQRMWFIDQLMPNSALYNIPLSLPLKGDLDRDVLQIALNKLIERHEVLRTVFKIEEGQPYQIIQDHLEFELPLIDVSLLKGKEKISKVEEYIQEETLAPFSLVDGPLIRASLIKLKEQEHIFLLTIHHIVADGWSLGVIYEELSELYNATLENREAQLPSLIVQYADFSVWQREYLKEEGDIYKKLLNYWTGELKGAPALLELPTDHPRPPIQSYKGNHRSFSISSELTKKLKELSEEMQGTLFMTLLAAFYILLYRYTNQEDMVVGSPIANRNRQEIENLVGFFVNTLALRANLSPDLSFKELLSQVKQKTLEAYDHQDLPFEKLVEHLEVERSLSHESIFQVMFALQNAVENMELKLKGLKVEEVSFEYPIAKFDLTLNLIEIDQQIQGSFEYATDLFNPSTIERMQIHFQNLLEEIVNNPNKSLSHLEMLTSEEKQQLLVTWNETQKEYPKDKTVHQLFEEQVKKTPNNIAVIFGDQKLTYQELNERANQLAHCLREQGVKPEILVTVLQERSIDYLTSILAIMKAGGAFLPIDPKYPIERISQIINQSRSPFILYHNRLRQECSMEKLSELLSTPVKILLLEDLIVDKCNQQNLLCLNKAKDLAYVIYTSGSTGLPKGAMVEHRGMVNHLYAKIKDLEITNAEILAQNASQSFDISVWQFLVALIVGGQVCIFEDSIAMDPLQLLNNTQEKEISILQVVPSMLRVILEELSSSPYHAELSKLRWLIATGEALPLDLIEAWTQSYPEIPLLNAYGPTECSDDVTHYKVDPIIVKLTNSVPIGKPVINTQIYILDRYLQLVPVGVYGEIYVGGDGVGRGYLHDPEKTAHSFISNPFVLSEEKKLGENLTLYKTGDLGRYWIDGTIEFLGRVDSQVKIRGYRIELGEIESVLSKHEAVSQAVVLVKEDASSGKKLIAYVTPNSNNHLEYGAKKNKEKESVSAQDIQIKQWRSMWNSTYEQDSSQEMFDLNLAGWDNSYSGKFTINEALESIENAVNKILRYKPKEVLEIGCGSGLLLFRIAPFCKRYDGIDISEAALNYISQHLTSDKFNNVNLFRKSADEIRAFGKNKYDMIILNNMIQYFPGDDYLQSLLRDALSILKPGGIIFVGDVYNFSLFEHFHTSVQLHRSKNDCTIEELRKRINRNMQDETELFVSPSFFEKFARENLQAGGVQIELKHGSHLNEIVKYRYDAIIHTNPTALVQRDKISKVFSWEASELNMSDIKDVLTNDDSCVVSCIQNKRLEEDVRTLKYLVNCENPLKTVGNLREYIKTERQSLKAVDPQLFLELGDEFQFETVIVPNHFEETGRYDVMFYKKNSEWVSNIDLGHKQVSEQPLFAKDSRQHSNNPLNWMLNHYLLESLKEYMENLLPEYMIPSAFIVLERLPLNANGKIDRKALLALDVIQPGLEKGYVAPRTEVENQLAEIWQEVLGLEKVGINDNFFEIGGHSLLATLLLSRLRRRLQLEIPLRSLFEHPTIAELSPLLESGGSQDNSLIPPIKPYHYEGPLPLSFAQQRLWFIDQLIEKPSVYNVPIALQLEGSLDKEVLTKAFEKLIRRHESLRTQIKTEEGSAYQVILDISGFKLEEVNLSELSASAQQEEIEKKIQGEEDNPFDLGNDLLIRGQLLELGPDKHALLITLHHIISDGWSMGIFCRELSELYNAALEAREAKLSDLPIQYKDFALWQREWLQGEVLEEQLGYWSEKLKDIPELISLPTDRPRSKESSYRGGFYKLSLKKSIVKGLQQLSQSQKVTLFMTMMAAFKVFLYRYSGQEDLVVGTPIANRHYPEVEGLIGFFVNTLALRTILKGEESFVEVLNKVRETTLEAYEHQDIPFEQLVDHLQVKRDFSRNPVFQVMFEMENVVGNQERADFFLQGLVVNDIYGEYRTAKFDLTLSAWEKDERLELGFEYAEDLYDRDTIERMGRHFAYLLESITERPDQAVNKLSLLDEEERLQVLKEWNATENEYPKDKCIHELFEEQVKKRPDAVAVAYEDQALTYQQLNERANQLAHHLRGRGVKPETLVAITCERSLEMIVGILGILKAGGAYIPIDPSYPPERIQFMLEDTKAPLLLTQKDILERLPITEAEVFLLDKDIEKLVNYPTTNPLCLTQSHHLAYVIYTSGSTGNPKGTLIPHSNVHRLFMATQDWYHFTDKDVWTLFHSYAFDFSVWEIWGALFHGGRLVIVPYLVTRSPEAFCQLLIDQKVTILNQTPSAFYQLISYEESLPQRGSLYLREVIFGGEALNIQKLVPWFKKHGDKVPRLVNMYGITETTVHVSYAPLCLEQLESTHRSPIGRPIPDLKVYILDPFLNLVPQGVSGELFVGGDGLARGYLNRPELTVERFIKNPFQTQEEKNKGKNTRLYKTGDLARYLPDGNIEYIGRNDDQVKIRGFRIELGEIESALLKHAQVKEAIVIVREDILGDKRLVGYVVLKKVQDKNQETVEVSELRTHLQSILPEYMVPSALMLLDAIPLTANGKVARKELSAPEYQGNEKTYVAPRTEIEKALCQIWQSILKAEKVGIQDNFFQVGGDSILSIQLISKIRQTLGFNISVKDIFNHNTIESLYDDVLSKNLEKADELQIKTEQGILKGEVPLLPIQRWFFDTPHVNACHWNQSFLIKTPSLNINKLQKSMEKLFQHHDAFRLRYKKCENTEYVQYYDPYAQTVELKKLDLRTLNAKEGSKAFTNELQQILTDWQSQFDLERGPLYSAGYIYGYKDGTSRIYFSLHHLIVDAVSWRILTEDLINIYYNKKLQTKGSSYRQWVEAVAEYAKTHEAEKEYWANSLSDYDVNLSPITNLGISEDIRNEVTLELTSQQTKKLLQECHKAYNTQINDILLTALALTLSEITGSKVHHIVLEGHGREEIVKNLDIAKTLGWFTTLYPVRLDIREDIGNSLKHIKETLRQIPNKGIGYGAVLGYQSKTLPRISFNYLGQFKDDKNQEGEEELWNIVSEESGNSMHESNQDSYILNMNGMVIDDSLKFTIESKLDKNTTEKIAIVFKNHLEEIITTLSNKSTPEYTMSDFNDFDPYVIFNDILPIESNKLFILPPGDGGAESYLNNIVKGLNSSGSKLILFNNYHDYLLKKFGCDQLNSITFESLANDYIAYIKSIQVKGPYNLFGWSFGGVLAFEIGRQLIAAGDSVANVILVDSFFDFKRAKSAVGPEFQRIQDINYRYSLSSRNIPAGFQDTNILLFKASRVEKMRNVYYHNQEWLRMDIEDIYKLVSRYYAEKTKTNHLSGILKNIDFKVIMLDCDHSSWITDNLQIEKICNEIMYCLCKSGLAKNLVA